MLRFYGHCLWEYLRTLPNFTKNGCLNHTIWGFSMEIFGNLKVWMFVSPSQLSFEDGNLPQWYVFYGHCLSEYLRALPNFTKRGCLNHTIWGFSMEIFGNLKVWMSLAPSHLSFKVDNLPQWYVFMAIAYKSTWGHCQISLRVVA